MTIQRCGWCSDDPLYMAYHDQEWGKPQHDETHLFEMLCTDRVGQTLRERKGM